MRDLLAGRGDDVELARIGIGREFLGQREQAVGLAAHRRHDDDELVSLALKARDAARDVADALDAADRGAAVFLHDQSHGAVLRVRAHSVRNAIVALVPPKPNELDSAARIGIGRAVLRNEIEIAAADPGGTGSPSAARPGRAGQAP